MALGGGTKAAADRRHWRILGKECNRQRDKRFQVLGPKREVGMRCLKTETGKMPEGRTGLGQDA